MTAYFSEPGMREMGLKNLKDACRVLRVMGLTWWIEAGTFLGIVRDGDLIGHDSDIDFGILGDERIEGVRELFLEEGFHVHHEFGTKGRGREISFKRGGIKVDVFCFYPDEAGTLWMGCWRGGRMIRLDFERRSILPPRSVTVFDIPMKLPALQEAYLRARYGREWTVPDLKWRWDRSPKCINWAKSDWTLKELEEKYP